MNTVYIHLWDLIPEYLKNESFEVELLGKRDHISFTFWQMLPKQTIILHAAKLILVVSCASDSAFRVGSQLWMKEFAESIDRNLHPRLAYDSWHQKTSTHYHNLNEGIQKPQELWMLGWSFLCVLSTDLWIMLQYFLFFSIVISNYQRSLCHTGIDTPDNSFSARNLDGEDGNLTQLRFERNQKCLGPTRTVK